MGAGRRAQGSPNPITKHNSLSEEPGGWGGGEVHFTPDPYVWGSRNDLTGGAFLPGAVGRF